MNFSKVMILLILTVFNNIIFSSAHDGQESVPDLNSTDMVFLGLMILLIVIIFAFLRNLDSTIESSS